METNDLLPCVEVNPSSEANTAIIWLHGLGADGHDFAPIVASLEPLPPELRIRFIFPHAPTRKVTMNQGIKMPAWFDLVGLSLQASLDIAGLHQAETWLNALIAREQARGIERQKIMIAGFSQGGVVAIYSALRHAEPIAGVIMLSSLFPFFKEQFSEHNFQQRALPVFQAHGNFDPVIPLPLGQYSNTLLKSLGLAVDWHCYPTAHNVCPDEIHDIRHWLVRLLCPQDNTHA